MAEIYIMHSDWETVLGQAGSIQETMGIQHFGQPQDGLNLALVSTIICPLTQYGFIGIQGEDKTVFCQGQFTSDIEKVSVDQSQLSAFCSPKGRMLACFRVFQLGDRYYLRLPLDTLEATLKRLQLFVLRAKVSLSDSSHQIFGLGLSGPDCADLLTDYIGHAVPSTVDQAMAISGLSVIRVAGEQPRFELYGDMEQVRTCWEALHQKAQPFSHPAWTLLNIRAGLPEVYAATADAFVPQMANLDLLHGISFKKGCYVGQEIVARMHYLGRLKRRMFRLQLDTVKPPSPGADLLAPERRGEQSVGQIVSIAPSPTGGCEALAVLVLDCLNEPLQLADHAATRVSRLDLPYAVEHNSSASTTE